MPLTRPLLSGLSLRLANGWHILQCIHRASDSLGVVSVYITPFSHSLQSLSPPTTTLPQTCTLQPSLIPRGLPTKRIADSVLHCLSHLRVMWQPHLQKLFQQEQAQGRYQTARQRRALQAKAAAEHSTQPSVAKPSQAEFVEKLAKVSEDKPQALRNSLDGLPTALRQHIFRLAEADGLQSHKDWKTKEHSQYDTLKLVSKQFYHDLQDMHWQCQLVRQNQTSRLIELPFFKAPFQLITPDRHSPLYKKLTSLTIEVPHSAGLGLLRNQSLALLALPLRELKLFFVGTDSRSVQTKLGFCGLRSSLSQGKLHADSQDFCTRALLIGTLSKLNNLETLVISNANMPVTYNQVINNKPYLRRLVIEYDPRTTVTDDWAVALNDSSDPHLQQAAIGSNAKIEVKALPDLEELEISANSMIMASRLVRETLHTLKKLTWLVPNVKNQGHGGLHPSQLRWLSQTAENLLVIAMNGQKNAVDTLRICIEEEISDPQSDSFDQNGPGALIHALISHVPQMKNLRNLELHLKLSKRWDDGLRIVDGFHPDLNRLYISEQMVAGAHLEVVHRLTMQNFGTHADARSRLLGPQTGDDERKDEILARKNLAFVGYEFSSPRGGTYRVVECSEENSLRHDDGYRMDLDRTAKNDERQADNGSTINDNESQADVNETRLRGRRLEKYLEQRLNEWQKSADVGIELLRLNGRLLDRERNQHLFLPRHAQAFVLLSEEGEVLEYPAPFDERPSRRFPVIVAASDCGHWMCE